MLYLFIYSFFYHLYFYNFANNLLYFLTRNHVCHNYTLKSTVISLFFILFVTFLFLGFSISLLSLWCDSFCFMVMVIGKTTLLFKTKEEERRLKKLVGKEELFFHLLSFSELSKKKNATTYQNSVKIKG